MSAEIAEAVERLNQILPLKQNQMQLDDSLKQLHLDILRSYVDNGRSLNRQEIAQRVDDADAATRILKHYDMVVFDEHGEPVGAYPFSMEKREHKLLVNDRLIHSMCALDSLAVSPMYAIELEISSVCHVSGAAISIRQKGLDIINLADVRDVYFGINWNAAAQSCCCSDSLCTEMIFLKGDKLAHDWRDNDAENRQIFNLPDAVRFAAGFFMPLLE